MSERVVLYTPGTGLPDAEAKLAFGLAYVAAQCPQAHFSLIPEGERYRLEFEGSLDDLERSFKGLLKKVLSNEGLYRERIPGIAVKIGKKGGISAEELVISVQDVVAPLERYLLSNALLERADGRGAYTCNHKHMSDNESKDKRKEDFTLYMGISPLVSKVPKPEFSKGRDNLYVCGVCFSLMILGSYFATLRLRNRKGDSFLIGTFIPCESLDDGELSLYFACQKEIAERKEEFIGVLPQVGYPFAIFAIYPHLTSLFLKSNLMIALLSGGRTPQTRNASISELRFVAEFLGLTGGRDTKAEGEKKEYRNPYLLWLINRLLREYRSGSKGDNRQQKVQALWGLIAKLAQEKDDVVSRRRVALNLVRQIVSIFSDDYELKSIRLGLARSLAKEDVMGVEELFEWDALRKLAQAIRRLTFPQGMGEETRNYWFVDQIRDALSSEAGRAKEVFFSMIHRAQRVYPSVVKKDESPVFPLGEQELAQIKEELDRDYTALLSALGLLVLCRGVPKGVKREVEVVASPFADEAVGRFASVMRYFVSGEQKRFDFIDRIAGAKSKDDVLPVLFRLLRQAWVEYTKSEEQPIFFPDERHLAALLEQLESDFERVRWALALRAMCWHTGRGKEDANEYKTEQIEGV